MVMPVPWPSPGTIRDTLMKLPLDGGCLCSAVRYRISAKPHDAGYCHCRICHRSTGAPMVAWLTMANDGFAWASGTPTSIARRRKQNASSAGPAAPSWCFSSRLSRNISR
jgi:hypothetical protein